MQKQTLRLFVKYSNDYAVDRALALLFPVLAVITTTIISPYILSLFIDQLQRGSASFANSGGLIMSYAALFFLGEVILWRLALYYSWTFEIKSQRDLYLAIFAKLSHEDTQFHASRFGGSLVSQSSKMTGAFERFWDMIVWSVLPIVTTVIGSIVSLLILGLWQYAIFIAGYTGLFAIGAWLGSRFLAKRNTIESQKSTKMSGYLADVVTNATTVKAFGREAYEQTAAAKRANDWKDASFRLKWGVIGTTTSFGTLITLGNVAAFIFAVYAAEHHLVTIGTAYLVLTYALNVSRQLWDYNGIIRTYNRVVGDAHDMTEILASPYKLIDRSTKKLIARHGNIDFKDVSFTHDRGDGERVFEGFNLTIPKGQRIGVVGRSGSGKTTLTRILLRFSDLDHGAITIDDQDISHVSQTSLHRSIAYVAQEPLLFHRSLIENISYGKPGATRYEVIRAAKKAHAWEFIKKLPQELDTLVGERGVKLSGGQRQRIAIARAILKDAPILVLDEATSALDSESEKLIQASLVGLMDNRTSIVIAHRLSTIAKLDRIIVLDNGKIVEDGTHTQLLQIGGIYASLWTHQSGGFIEEKDARGGEKES